MSAAGDRARARIRRNRRELEFLALSGAFGPIAAGEPEETIEEFAAKVGCTVADLIATADAAAGASEDDDGEICNPPAGASWVVNRTTPLSAVPKSHAERGPAAVVAGHTKPFSRE